MIALGDTPAAVYVGNHQPVNLYAGNVKVAGWHETSASGSGAIDIDGDYYDGLRSLAVDGKATQTPAIWGANIVANGDFSNGTTGWTTVNSTIAIESGRLAITPSLQWGRATCSISVVANHKYYAAALLDGDTNNYLELWSDVGNVFLTSVGNNRVRFIGTATSTGTTQLNIGDKTSSGWDKFYVDNVIAIDLTATFGAGKEPTAAQMDAMLATYPNSWFNGANILTTDVVTYTANSPSPTYQAPISVITGNAVVTTCGKNLLNAAVWEMAWSNTATYAPNTLTCVCTTQSGYPYIRYGFKLTVGITYTLNCNFLNASGNQISVQVRRANGTTKVKTMTSTATSGTVTHTFTAADTTMYLILYPNESGTPNTNTVSFSNIQLEVGSSATAYEPYVGASATIALGTDFVASLSDGTKDTVTVDATGAVSLVHNVKCAVFDGSADEVWAYDEYQRGNIAISGSYSTTSETECVAILCDRFLPSFYAAWNVPNNNRKCMLYASRLYAGYNGSDLATFKAWLAANPTTVYYKLATPTTTSLGTIPSLALRHGIKHVTVTNAVASTISATVSTMD